MRKKIIELIRRGEINGMQILIASKTLKEANKEIACNSHKNRTCLKYNHIKKAQ